MQKHLITPPLTETHDIEYTYDKLNRLIEESADDGSSNGYTGKYVYDLVGNREQRIVTANGQTLTTDYDYDDNDRLEKEIHTGPVAAIPFGSDRVYAYASGNGNLTYELPGSDKRIGQFKAFFMGLPSRFSLYLFFALLILVPVAFFGPVLAEVFAKLRKTKRKRSGVRLSLYHRCMSVLLAYVMLLSPGVLESVAQGAFLYSQASTANNWHKGDRTIEYDYDANGSVIEKVTIETSTENTLETITYDYNLQNRLESVDKEYVDDSNDTINEVTQYTYNDDGIRVESYYYKTTNGGDPEDEKTITYLVDSYNHTGYAQVFEEYDGTTRKVYLIGQEVFGQAITGMPLYYLRDGHNSVRQLEWAGTYQNYAYDAYGVAVGFDPSSAYARHLYAGEQYDKNLSQYYLRARYYDPANGRFNRVDPYAGNNQDPQSLHKYLYCHANPVNGIDPSGNSFILNVTVSTVIRGTIAAMTFGTVSTIAAKVRGATWGQALWAGLRTAGITGFAFVSPLMAWSLAAVTPAVVGIGIYSGDITGEDVPEIAAYVAAGIALMLLFKSPQFKVWEVKTALKVKLPKALSNLRNETPVNPDRVRKWKRAVTTGNKAAQGSLIHAELADIMRAEGMTNLGIEVSYDAAGNLVTYGTKGSVRLDYTIYHKGQIVKVIDLKSTDVISGNWLSKASQYIKLSAEDFEALSYGGK